jgi:cytochrome c oxidase subunit 2
MPIVVEVKTPEDYQAWVEAKQAEQRAKADDPTRTWTQAELVERGAQVFASQCVACHQASGRGIPGAFPALVGSPVVLGEPAGQIKVLLNGRAGTAMASFKQLSDVELAAVMTYTRNAWGNQAAASVVQPAALTAARP